MHNQNWQRWEILTFDCRVGQLSVTVKWLRPDLRFSQFHSSTVPRWLPTTVAPVEHMLATVVALGSFTAALILLCPSMIIFLSDFAAECFFTCVNQVKMTCFQPNWKQRHRKEVNFWPISFEMQLPVMTFKPISMTDRNVVRQAEFCVPNLADLVLLMC